jgi:hypothetical protein
MTRKSPVDPDTKDLLRMKNEMDRIWKSVSRKKPRKPREEAWELNPSPEMDVCVKRYIAPFWGDSSQN